MFEFTEEQRAIFEYNDGTKDVKADPLEIRRRLLFELPNISQLIREQRTGEHMLTSKERQIFRRAVEGIIYDALKTEALTIEDIIRGVDEDPAWVRKIVNEMVGTTLARDGVLYRSCLTEEASAYFIKEEGVAAMTAEEASIIRMGKKAEETIVNGLRYVFSMGIDEAHEGPTDAMVWAVFYHYQDWMQKKSGTQPKKPTSSTSSPGSTAKR